MATISIKTKYNINDKVNFTNTAINKHRKEVCEKKEGTIKEITVKQKDDDFFILYTIESDNKSFGREFPCNLLYYRTEEINN